MSLDPWHSQNLDELDEDEVAGDKLGEDGGAASGNKQVAAVS